MHLTKVLNIICLATKLKTNICVTALVASFYIGTTLCLYEPNSSSPD